MSHTQEQESMDCYLDLKALSKYSSMGVPTRREHLRGGGLPYFKVKGKVLIRRSEFDAWVEQYRVQNSLKKIVDEVMNSLQSDR